MQQTAVRFCIPLHPQQSARDASADNFKALAEASGDVVCATAGDGTIVFLNAAGRRFIGLSDDARDLPMPAGALVDGDQTLLSERVAQVCASRIAQQFELRFKHHQTGASMSLWCQLFPLKHAEASDVPAAALVGRQMAPHTDTAPPSDIDDVSAATRLSEMFAGIVGHDLRNPLNAILTCAHFVIQSSNDELTRSTVQRIISSGHRMQRMIDQLLDLTRIRSGGGIQLQFTRGDLAATLQQGIQEVSAAHPDCEIRLEVRGDTVGLWDIDRLAQLVSNLLGNAAQHGDREECVSVILDGTDADEVIMLVRNKGVIPAEYLPVLFNPFRILHQKRHKSVGLGLGLFVSRQIALGHGGGIDVTSTAESGTTFRVRLPRHSTASQPLAATSGLGAEDMAILEMIATAPKATSVTAQLFGAVALHERAPQQYWAIFDRYARVLDAALDEQTYKTSGPRVSSELRDIAEQLGRLGAGSREVAELHARALRHKTRSATVAKAQALTSEGRIVSFELMGHLLSFYRRRAGVGA
jgi:signal transduction histidine kinase